MKRTSSLTLRALAVAFCAGSVLSACSSTSTDTPADAGTTTTDGSEPPIGNKAGTTTSGVNGVNESGSTTSTSGGATAGTTAGSSTVGTGTTGTTAGSTTSGTTTSGTTTTGTTTR
jgi:hypothetical protein